MLPDHFIKINYGQWMTQKTVFIIHSKVIYTHQSRMSINNCNSSRIEVDDFGSTFFHSKSIFRSKVLDFNRLTSFHFLNTDEDFDSKIQKIINGEKNEFFALDAYVNTLSHILLKHTQNSFSILEKLWLVNPNLRLGITLIEKQNRCVAVCFCSDIRIH